jgi:hypothetical protein
VKAVGLHFHPPANTPISLTKYELHALRNMPFYVPFYVRFYVRFCFRFCIRPFSRFFIRFCIRLYFFCIRSYFFRIWSFLFRMQSYFDQNRQNSLFSFPGPSTLIFQPGTGQADRPSLGSATAAPPSPFQMNKANGPIMPGHPSMHGGRCGSFPAFLLERCESARSARPLTFSNSRGKWNLDGMRRVFTTYPTPI